MSKEIIVFSAAWCSQCGPWKKMLEEKGIEYTPIDVDSEDGMVQAQEYQVRALPTTIILRDGYLERKIVGTQMKELNSLKEEE